MVFSSAYSVLFYDEHSHTVLVSVMASDMGSDLYEGGPKNNWNYFFKMVY